MLSVEQLSLEFERVRTKDEGKGRCWCIIRSQMEWSRPGDLEEMQARTEASHREANAAETKEMLLLQHNTGGNAPFPIAHHWFPSTYTSCSSNYCMRPS